MTRLGIRYPGDMAAVRREKANMGSALQWLLMAGRIEEGLALCQALSGFWLAQGFLGEGQEWLERFLAGQPKVPGRVFAGALHAWGRLAEYAGGLDRARELFERSRDTSSAAGDGMSTSRALCGLGDVALHHGGYLEASRLFQEALDLAQSVDSAPETAQAMMCLGRAASLNGDLEQSGAWLEEALTIQRQLGDPWGVAYVLTELAQQAHRAGQLERAEALFEECHVLWRRAGTMMGERSAVLGLALVTLARGVIVRSAGFSLTSLELCHDMRDDASATTVRCVEIAAQIIAAFGAMSLAVELVAAATRRREMLDAPRPDVERPEIEGMLRAARGAIGASAFETASRAGRDLSISDAAEAAAIGLVAALEKSSS